MVNKVLFITLSNIGDAILSLPSLDAIREKLPQAQITVMAGPRTKEIFQDNPYVSRLVVFTKHSGLKEKIKLFHDLKKENFDMVVDLRNSLFGLCLPARYKIPPFLYIPKNIKHMQSRHLYKIRRLLFRIKSSAPQDERATSLFIPPQEEAYIKNILKENNIGKEDLVIAVAPGSRSHIKRWAKEKFTELISCLAKDSLARIILVGDRDDQPIAQYVIEHCSYPLVDLSGRTTIAQLAALLKRVRLLISNDSATLHLASYLNLPVVAVFGPTDEDKYGPWSDNVALVKKDISCRPCAKAQCRFGTLDCMAMIRVEDVLRATEKILAGAPPQRGAANYGAEFRRILISRTDRIGDVLLSTPVAKALRDRYPAAYIAMVVSGYAKDVVDGNPYLDEVIVYDKDLRHRSWLDSIKFADFLSRKKFDLALIIHPTNRMHLITFLAGIPRRIGYNRKFGFLLTDRIKHTKQFGAKHELEYALDLVRYLGIEPKDKSLFMPIKPEAEKWVIDLFKEKGIARGELLLAIHPGASCPSKVWPHERFARVADKLIEKYGFRPIVVSGPRDIAIAKDVIKNMRYPVVDLAGMTSVAQLASVLKRCRLFISNDSGPVHIAASLGVPVVAIFGRSQPGLSPRRWGPQGGRSQVLHKDVGCIKCLAHNCTKEFLCLKAISVDDVIAAADSIIRDTLQANREGVPKIS